MATNPNMARQCYICGESRVVERAHILPKMLFDRKGVNADLYDFGGKNIVILCPTHHKLYDRHLLSESEKVILGDRIYELIPEMTRIGKDWDKLRPSSKRITILGFEKWFSKFKEQW